MVIGTNLATRVSVPPYLRDTYDKEAVIQGIDFIRSALSKVNGLTWITPTASQTTTAFVNSVRHLHLCESELQACSSTDDFQIPATVASRGSNHWVGSCTIGADDGRSGGKAVVDLDTKVYGSEHYCTCSSDSSLTSQQLIIYLLLMPPSSQESLPGIHLQPLSLWRSAQRNGSLPSSSLT
jgi:hypothetical protein